MDLRIVVNRLLRIVFTFSYCGAASEFLTLCAILALQVPRVGFSLCVPFLLCKCREWDSNPHSHYWPRDFKSLVSTNSTIAALHLRCLADAKVRLNENNTK